MTTMMNAPDGAHLGTPEDFMVLRPDAPAGVPIDAIECAIARANSILILLQGEFESKDSNTLSNGVISNVLWSVQGILEEIRILANNKETAVQA